MLDNLKRAIHLGEKVKERAKEIRMGPTELGRLIGTSKQNIYAIYRRKSIDTDLLLRLSGALEFDFFELFVVSSKSEHPEVDLAKIEKLADQIRWEVQKSKPSPGLAEDGSI